MIKTIFITIFQGVEARNILRTDIYRELAKRPDIRLVLFTTSQAKKEYYEKEFHGPNIVYEVVEDYAAGGLQRFFGAVKFNLINTATIDVKRRLSFQSDKSYLKFVWRFLFNRVFAHRPVRKLVRWLDWRLVSDRFFSPYFEKYQPSAVFMAHLFGGVETAMLREARHRGIATIGLINSWDKVTARAMIRLLPDELIVHNDLVKKDALDHTDMPEDRIFVSGIPYFDYYFQTERSTREEFCKKFGIDPKDRIILYTPVGRTNSSGDAATISMLDRLLTTGQLSEGLRVIVRFPPNDEVELPTGFKSKFIFQRPGKRFSAKRGTDWDMNFEDLRDLADTLYHCDLAIGYSSTTAIDVAVFDKPIINIDFDLPGVPSIRWVYQVSHYQPVLKTGAVRLVRSEAELVGWVKKYLADPSLDRAERKRLVLEQCANLDGQAGKRVAKFLLDKALATQ